MTRRPTAAGDDTRRADGPSGLTGAEAARLLRLLTPREAQVLALLAAGHDADGIARALGIPPGAARVHLHRAMRKLGVQTRASAAALATRLADPAPATERAERAERPTSRRRRAARSRRSPGRLPDGVRLRPAHHTPPRSSPGSPLPAAPEPAADAPQPVASLPTEPTAPPVLATVPATGTVPAAAARPVDFEAFCAAAHARLVQQVFLVATGRRRARHCVHAALGAASRRWETVSRLPDPEGWVRARAFDAVLSPWRRGGPRRTHRLHPPRLRIRVRPATEADAPPDGLTAAEAAAPTGRGGRATRPTRRDRALLRALRRLPRPQRRAVVLHDAVGLPVDEVAYEVESSTAAAAGRVLAARAALAASVPELVGDDPADPAFGDRLGGLLHRAAVRGCPAPRPPAAATLTTASLIRTAVGTGAAGLLSTAMGVAILATLLGGGPSTLFRQADPEPGPPACAGGAAVNTGPVLPGFESGVQSLWCNPSAGDQARLADGPPAPTTSPSGSESATAAADPPSPTPAGPPTAPVRPSTPAASAVPPVAPVPPVRPSAPVERPRPTASAAVSPGAVPNLPLVPVAPGGPRKPASPVEPTPPAAATPAATPAPSRPTTVGCTLLGRCPEPFPPAAAERTGPAR
ncbi:sigma factor-like helix-turn-helix DNA-binding protein [Kitasatospora camelliae]|uniref:Sigma factor-like helix-turn-helix DNA-binding protein n=1 Tax=Kitasatospora camelliae TaxID=3156397 RepID=A0AAU8JW05_9ACTN